MNKKILLLLLLSISTSIIKAQSKFQFIKKAEKEVIQFRLINNLIVFPLRINGKELSFILDTGVRKSILFNLNEKDSLILKNTQKVYIRGLGAGKPVEAIRSKKNEIRIKNVLGFSQEVFVILDDTFKLSSKMGTTIHGIIGHDLLKDVIVRVNYNSKTLTLYDPKAYEQPRCGSCEALDIEFYNNKPFINITISTDSIRKNIPVTMLVDSGGSDAVWMFEGTDKNITTPEKYFVDILGEGLSGTIYGKRSRVSEVKIGKYVLEGPTASFLDTVSTFNARKYTKRNGSIGGGILKRFKVWIDYPNKKLTLKKSSSLSKGFHYNMSGLHVVYNGLELVKEKNDLSTRTSFKTDDTSGNVISFVTSYAYKFKPSFRIESVVKGSPADIVGIEPGDVIKKINGKFGHEYTLESISALFQARPNKKISMVIERGVVDLKYKFYLEPRI
ncbi:Aspartyl protease [Tenacibaculum sp. MAR_2009_124]|uniref:aspartyl protease family protein n=1 Tax=Tenacibaculum sp. MAR_2009_124 TaxID=1250059 RepID=UPI000899A457|nr:aspartyl protease family protein [Tenacibaculum sp. MAR_2009_124]SEB43387.1 Aspartyl protease [Tenacibaculum sp. MAR_2009_124]